MRPFLLLTCLDTFDGDFFGGSPTAFTNGGPPLLNETENQSLLDFFSQDPFGNDGPPFSATTDTKNGMDDFNWDFVPPPNVHQVSTTIPDQRQLNRGFHTDHFAPDPLSNSHLPTTQADLQAASTLFGNTQVSHAAGRSYSMPTVPSMHPLPAPTADPVNLNTSSEFQTNIPLVPTPHGMMSEQLAALLPNHSEQGSIDAQVAAQFSNVPQSELVERHKPNLKRSYTYGTDAAFNSNGYVPPNPHAEEEITYRLINDVFRAQPFLRQPAPGPDGENPPSPTGHINLPASFVTVPSDAEQSEDETSGEDDGEGYAKKRRRTKNGSKGSGTQRKSISGRSGKRKSSVDDHSGRKKRLSTAGQKPHRENLTEEQKRSNHILSEQKRRNLIKRGFDDLHDLVPEIRNGGLSKSSVLMEAAAFLENIIADNIRFMRLSGTADG
jgi:hypothetical protein